MSKALSYRNQHLHLLSAPDGQPWHSSSAVDCMSNRSYSWGMTHKRIHYISSYCSWFCVIIIHPGLWLWRDSSLLNGFAKRVGDWCHTVKPWKDMIDILVCFTDKTFSTPMTRIYFAGNFCSLLNCLLSRICKQKMSFFHYDIRSHYDSALHPSSATEVFHHYVKICEYIFPVQT